MGNSNLRLIEADNPPAARQVNSWLRRDAYYYWTRISKLIEKRYPGVFIPEWLYGGKKHGWSLRYKKSKSFCTLIPEKNRCLVLMVFGSDERNKVELVRNEISKTTMFMYDEAKTYHDGKWLLLNIDNEKMIQDVEILFETKRDSKGNK